MEKRLLLFFVLSFLFLMIWGKMKPSPSLSPEQQQPDSQLFERQEDTEQTPKISPLKQESPSKFDNKEIKEETRTLENESLNLVFSNKGGSIKEITISTYGEKLPLEKVFNVTGLENEQFLLDYVSGKEISYSFVNKDVKIKKVFSLGEKDYLLNLKVIIENLSPSPKELDVRLDSFFLDINKLDEKAFNRRDQGLIEYAVSSSTEILRKTNAIKFSDKERKKHQIPVRWVSYRNRYFCAVIKPLFETKGFSISPHSEKNLSIILSPVKKRILPGESYHMEAVAYIGPQNIETLKSYHMGFEEVMVFFRAGFFDAIAKGILKIITLLHNFISSWGICIIIIGAAFYLLLYPLTIKSMLSMRKMQTEMQSVQPQITKIRERYKNNPQKLNEEMAKLYKEHNINPLRGCSGGCLPMFLQMPIFIGLYQVLWRSVIFKGEPFLWIKDLSEPDHLFKFPISIPLLGEYFNILPLLVMVFMAVQQRFSAKNMPVTDPAQAEQQKMMAILFPVMIGYFFYKLASGLCLYFTVFYMLSTYTQWKMSKKKKVT
jgi:YidC/Oxa1 family membrane protein insertase